MVFELLLISILALEKQGITGGCTKEHNYYRQVLIKAESHLKERITMNNTFSPQLTQPFISLNITVHYSFDYVQKVLYLLEYI